MTTNCNPCTCPEQYYRDEHAFRKAVIVLLTKSAGLGADPKCDPSACPEKWYRDTEQWRKAVIILLCRLASNLGQGQLP